MKNKLLKLISIIVALLVFYQFPLTVKADTVMKNSISEVNLENFKKEKKNLLYSELDKSGRPTDPTLLVMISIKKENELENQKSLKT